MSALLGVDGRKYRLISIQMPVYMSSLMNAVNIYTQQLSAVPLPGPRIFPSSYSVCGQLDARRTPSLPSSEPSGLPPSFLEISRVLQKLLITTSYPDSSVHSSPTPCLEAVPAVPPNLASCKFVFIRVDGSGRPPLAPLYTGPFEVLERYESTFKVQLGTRTELINISRLKPAFTPTDAVPALDQLARYEKNLFRIWIRLLIHRQILSVNPL